MRRRIIRRVLLSLTALTLALALAAGLTFFTHSPAKAANHPAGHAATNQLVGPKAYYLGMGDSIAFGYQPNGDWNHGYVQDLFSGNLQRHGTRTLINYGCSGETTATMIYGGCPGRSVLHNPYTGPQLAAAVSFLQSHPGQVSPVTLDIGTNDLTPVFNFSNCTVNPTTLQAVLATIQYNLTQIILPQLVQALTVHGQRAGDLIMMNYYSLYIKICPNSLPYVEDLNQVIASSAAQFGVRVVDVFDLFGGQNEAQGVCYFTWMCSLPFFDVHPNDNGYSQIAKAFGNALGY